MLLDCQDIITEILDAAVNQQKNNFRFMNLKLTDALIYTLQNPVNKSPETLSF